MTKANHLRPVTLASGEAVGPFKVTEILSPFGNVERAEVEDGAGAAHVLFLRPIEGEERERLNEDTIRSFTQRCRRLDKFAEDPATAPAVAFDFDKKRSAFWVAYRKPRGIPLADYLEELQPLHKRQLGHLWPVQGLVFWEELASSLEFGAKHGFVHGLLTPAWIYVLPTAGPKLSGIVGAGVREVLGVRRPIPAALEDFPFSAPETFRRQVCAAADIYSCARVLQALVAGPFVRRRESPTALSVADALKYADAQGVNPSTGDPTDIAGLIRLMTAPLGERPASWDQAFALWLKVSDSVSTPILASRLGREILKNASLEDQAAAAELLATQPRTDHADAHAYADAALQGGNDEHATDGPASAAAAAPPAPLPRGGAQGAAPVGAVRRRDRPAYSAAALAAAAACVASSIVLVGVATSTPVALGSVAPPPAPAPERHHPEPVPITVHVVHPRPEPTPPAPRPRERERKELRSSPPTPPPPTIQRPSEQALETLTSKRFR